MYIDPRLFCAETYEKGTGRTIACTGRDSGIPTVWLDMKEGIFAQS